MKTIIAIFCLLGLISRHTEATTSLCFGSFSSVFDNWCNNNCNHVPSYCPSSYCRCASGPSPTPSQSPNLSSNICRSLSVVIPDSWCQNMCFHTPPFCPQAYCDCQNTPEPSPAYVVEHQPGCCHFNKKIYFVDNFNVQYVTIDASTHLPISTPQLCASFLSPLDIELASDESIFVADTVSSRIYRISPGCADVKIVLDWTTDQYIPHPRAIAISNGGLYIAGSTKIYFVKLDSNYKVISVDTTSITNQGVISMDVAPDGRLFFVEPGNVKVYNPTTGAVSNYATLAALGWPDINGIKISSCGIYLSVTDSNQIWKCSDINSSASCHMTCQPGNIDASTCLGVREPYGLTLDCDCNVYGAQQGGGSLVFINSSGNSTLSFATGLYHPYDLELFETNQCQPSPSPTPSPGPSQSPTPSPSKTPTNTQSPTPSGTPSGTQTPTKSSSMSPSMSPTPTASVSISTSPTPTSTRSPSPTPTSTYQLAIRIDDYNTACASGNCGTNDTTALSQANNSRKFGILYLISFAASLISNDFSQCFLVSVVGSTVVCSKLIDPTTFISPDFTTIKVFIQSSVGLPPPAYAISPAIFGANVFPNASSNKIVAGQIACTGYNSIALRVVLNDPLPCWNDSLFGKVICSTGRTTAVSDASSWVNSSGQTMSLFSPYHDVSCVCC